MKDSNFRLNIRDTTISLAVEYFHLTKIEHFEYDFVEYDFAPKN